MKISYTAATSYTVLGDESDRTALVELLQPNFSQLVQSSPLARATTPGLWNRGNASCGLTLHITITYSSRANALAAIRTLRGVLKNALHLKVEQDSETQYYPQAVCHSYVPGLRGLSVTHQIQWTTQDVTSSAPGSAPV